MRIRLRIAILYAALFPMRAQLALLALLVRAQKAVLDYGRSFVESRSHRKTHLDKAVHRLRGACTSIYEELQALQRTGTLTELLKQELLARVSILHTELAALKVEASEIAKPAPGRVTATLSALSAVNRLSMSWSRTN